MQLGEKTRARLGRLVDIVYYLLILAGFYLFMKYAFTLLLPFVFAFCIAVILQRPVNYAQRKIKLKKGFTSAALVLLFYLLIVLIIALIGARIWIAAKDFTGYLSGQVKNLPKIIGGLQARINLMVAWLPDSIETRVNAWLASFTGDLLAGVNAQGENVGMFGSLL
ncbi:MAG: AI-2E family transporter, partial [Oscillospiraceae bacterium]|nr:AI-2E family transporter [Oscillospiraceae bacterium]